MGHTMLSGDHKKELADPAAFTSVYIAPAVEARRRVAKIFSALGHPTRLALLSRLTGGEPRSIVTLAREVKLTRQTIMKHLDALEFAGLVDSLRVGRERQYTFQPRLAAEAGAYLDAAVRAAVREQRKALRSAT